uniref:CSON004848 protein n=1 Tax=Culicoides sonorensis TaxID=179676 RepID=A0A336LUR1_CULSO
MVNCGLNQKLINSKVVTIDKIDTAAGIFLHRLDKDYISDVIFEVCKDCFKMPSVPQGAFAVHKVKEKQKHVAVCKSDNCNDDNKGRFDLKHNFSKLGPVKYNEKMMNSIWGRYNRNSPHNFKKNNAADATMVGLQQPIAVAQDLSIVKETSPNQKRGQFLSAAFAAAGFGVVRNDNLSQETHHLKENIHHDENMKENHHYELEHEQEHGPLGAHGRTHHHGHHGNFHGHHGHGDHSHYEQIWNYSVI